MQEIEERSEATYRAVLRRIWRTSIGAWAVFLIPVFWLAGWRGALGLTCSAAVVMINFLWLEEIVRRTLQPAPQVKFWKVFSRVLVRFALLGTALVVTLIVVRFEAISVVLGFSVIVVGIMGEAVRAVGARLGDDGSEVS